MQTCTEAALHAALAGGGHVTFACDSTIFLSAPLWIPNIMVLDGTGRAVVLSGNKAVRVLEVLPGAALALTNLTIADGTANRGGGLLNHGAEVIADGCRFLRNEARGTNGLNNASGGPATGGAIWSAGAFTLIKTAALKPIAPRAATATAAITGAAKPPVVRSMPRDH